MVEAQVNRSTVDTYWSQRVVPTTTNRQATWLSFYNVVDNPATGTGSVVMSGTPTINSIILPNSKAIFGINMSAATTTLLVMDAFDNIRINGTSGLSDIYLNPTTFTTGGISVKSNGRVGVDVITPSAWFHLPVGVIGTSGAPLKFSVAGSSLTTNAEQGTMEVNALGQLYFSPANADRRAVLLSGNILAGSNVTLTGSGTSAAPYTITAGGGSSALTTNYVGYGVAGVLGGSANFQHDGTNAAIGPLPITSTTKLRVSSALNGGMGIAGLVYGAGSGINYGQFFSSTGSTVLNVGTYGEATRDPGSDPPFAENYGGWFVAGDATINHCVRLQDGTESTGGILTSTDNAGRANWSQNIAVTGTVGAANLLSGTYTPTLFNTTNVAASTAYVTGYYRIGNSVTVYGKVDIDVTLAASTASELQMTLPIASNMTAEQDLGGTAVSDGVASLSARIKCDPTTDRASVVFKAISLSNDSYSFEFSYQIK